MEMKKYKFNSSGGFVIKMDVCGDLKVFLGKSYCTLPSSDKCVTPAPASYLLGKCSTA
jgi:hypothetical protein